MSTPEPPPGSPRRPGTGPVSALQNTPNAERYVLEADAMRRRQLRSALLHGSRRTWREHQRSWPAVTVGLLVAAFIVAGIIVYNAVQVTEDNTKKQEQERQAPATSTSAPASPSAQP
ncbi:MAG: ABC transporter permease [Actinomycetales bacterium]|nr:MAG: ABC transporter permease [Actinomycetales bacterium]